MINSLRTFSFIICLIFCALPLLGNDHYRYVTLIMFFATVFAYIMILLSTIQVAPLSFKSEENKYQQWWDLYRGSLRWQVFFVPIKIGLAYEFAKYFRVVPIYYVNNYILKPYFYSLGSHDLEILFQWERLLVAIIAIISFSIVNHALLCSIIIMTKGKISRILTTLGFFALITLGIASISASTAWTINPCSTSIRCGGTPQSYRRINETIYTTSNTFTGQGIFLSANIMRPSNLNRDNRPFVARQVVAGLLGLLFYAGSTWVILWFIEDESESTLI